MDARKNFAVSAVATAPNPATSGTSLLVTGGQGTRFPAAPFNAVVCPATANPTPLNAEIVRVTARNGNTLTISRAQESSTARGIQVGDRIYAGPTALTFQDLENALNLVEAGVTEAIQDEATARATADTDLQDQIDTATTTGPIGYVAHGADPDVARPTEHEIILWYGSVEPDNAEAADLWINEGVGGGGGGGDELAAHIGQSQGVHGISNAAQLVYTNDVRLLPVIEKVAVTSATTIATSHLGKQLQVNSASSAVTITFPTGIGQDGSVIEILQLNDGPVDFAGSGVGFVSIDDMTSMDSRGSVVRATRLSTNSWHLGGDLVP